MTNDNKTKMLAALTLFATAGASASEIKTVMIAKDKNQVVVCDVSRLDRKKTLEVWPGTIAEGVDPGADNATILEQINKNFAGGNYFDSYPHKLPQLFKAGACVGGRK